MGTAVQDRSAYKKPRLPREAGVVGVLPFAPSFRDPDNLMGVFLATSFVATMAVGRKYYDWGCQSVGTLKGLHDGQKYPAFVDSGLHVVTRANAAKFGRKWKSAEL